MPEEKKKEEKQEAKQVIKATGSPDKVIPKLCTHVNFGVTQDKHVIITLVFQNEDNEERQSLLIERVVTTFDHAKNIAKVLNDLIERVEKNEPDIQNTK